MSAMHPDGEPLAQYLARAGRLPILQGLALCVQLLWTVDQLHRSGVVHGGLDFTRLLVTRTGRLVVLDLGGQAAMAPDTGVPWAGEQDAGSQRGRASDIFAAALVAYELLTGQSPFPTTESQRMSASESGEAPRRVRVLRPELPPALDAVFERALATGQDDRYRTAADLSAALQAAIPRAHWDRPCALPGRMSQASDAPPVRPRPRRKVTVALAAAFSAFAVLAATTLWEGQSAAPADALLPAPQPTPVVVVPVRENIQPAAKLVPAAAAEQDDASFTERRDREPVAAVPAHVDRRPTGRAAPPRAPARHVPVRTARLTQPGPDANCPSALAFAPELCMALRCATAEFRHHPVCVRMHAEGARARARLAETYGGP